MSWGPQQQELNRKLFDPAGSLKRLRNSSPFASKVALRESLILPILDYADISYLDLTKDQLKRVERIQNFCKKIIIGLRKLGYINEYQNKLNWLPSHLRKTLILTLLYNILFNPHTPLYLKERFNIYVIRIKGY